MATTSSHPAPRAEPRSAPRAVPGLGERIRAVRMERGVSVRGLAREVGVSASLVSQIETGKSQPSVSTLYAITSALGVSVEDVFDAPGPPPDDGVTAAALSALAGPEGETFLAGATRVGPVVRPAGREVLVLDSGVTWERLGRVPGHDVDFLLVTYAPGGASSGTDRLMRHPGTEYGYLVSGELVATLGFAEHRLRPGDAISFPSSTPHRYRNDGDEPAVGVWFVSDLFSDS
ncbi:MAG: helix-turn-helix domain-containing protein [Actinomycetes bacterium]